eukprot:gene6707-8307_t
MLKSEKFWETEYKIPLMKMERDFIKEEGLEKILERVAKWPELAGLKKEDIKKVDLPEVKDPEEIFSRDADRTFATEENRKKLIKIITYLKKQFGDYQQGLSFVTSFFMLTMNDDENIALMIKINSMIPGYWKLEAVDFGVSAFTFYHILQDTFPKITQHLEKNTIDPGVFCHTWFLGLCVHLLPFKHLFQFFELFLVDGVDFLYRFGLGLFAVLGDRILASNNADVIFALIRLNESAVTEDHIFQAILDRSKDFDLKKYDIKAISKKIYEEKIQERLEKARKVHAQVEIDPDCQWCDDNLPEFYCKECGVVICQDCLDSPPEDNEIVEKHKEDHTLITMGEYEDEKQLASNLEKLSV